MLLAEPTLDLVAAMMAERQRLILQSSIGNPVEKFQALLQRAHEMDLTLADVGTSDQELEIINRAWALLDHDFNAPKYEKKAKKKTDGLVSILQVQSLAAVVATTYLEQVSWDNLGNDNQLWRMVRECLCRICEPTGKSLPLEVFGLTAEQIDDWFIMPAKVLVEYWRQDPNRFSPGSRYGHFADSYAVAVTRLRGISPSAIGLNSWEELRFTGNKYKIACGTARAHCMHLRSQQKEE